MNDDNESPKATRKCSKCGGINEAMFAGNGVSFITLCVVHMHFVLAVFLINYLNFLTFCCVSVLVTFCVETSAQSFCKDFYDFIIPFYEYFCIQSI